MNDQKQCAKCGKTVSATQSCDCAQLDAKPTTLKNNQSGSPTVTTSGANTEYEFSSPVVYDGGTGEYEFGVMQNKKTGEHARDVTLDDEDDDERGPTLLMDKPHIKKTIGADSALLSENATHPATGAHLDNTTQPARTKPAGAIKIRPKPTSSSVHPGLFIVFVVLFITFVGVVFFFMATTKQHFKSHKEEPAIVQPAK